MSMKAYQERLIALVKDTVTLLCKNGLEYSQEFCVEGLLGVTLDKNEVFLIPIKELVNDKGVGTTDDAVEASHEADEGLSPKRERKKKRRHVESTDQSRLESPIQYETGTEWQVDSKERLHDNNQAETDPDPEERTGYQETDSTDHDLQPPSSKQRRRQENRTDLSRVKAEDIVVIKEEVDDEEFASAFQDSSMDSINMSRTEQGDSSMGYFPQPGTSRGGMSFSMDQLASSAGLAGAMQVMPPGSEADDGSWLQNPEDMPQGDWQNQKHQLGQYVCQVCGKAYKHSHHLQRHQKSAHLKFRFSCSICSKTYSQQEGVKRHQRIAHGITGDVLHDVLPEAGPGGDNCFDMTTSAPEIVFEEAVQDTPHSALVGGFSGHAIAASRILAISRPTSDTTNKSDLVELPGDTQYSVDNILGSSDHAPDSLSLSGETDGAMPTYDHEIS